MCTVYLILAAAFTANDRAIFIIRGFQILPVVSIIHASRFNLVSANTCELTNDMIPYIFHTDFHAQLSGPGILFPFRHFAFFLLQKRYLFGIADLYRFFNPPAHELTVHETQ